MRKILKDFYYGNITPSEGDLATNSNLKRAMVKITQCESQLTEQLNEAERALLTELTKAQHEVDDITALESFILGFRLGVRIMAECMDIDDGDIKYERR